MWLLLERNADVNAKNRSGETALHIAARHGARGGGSSSRGKEKIIVHLLSYA